MPNCSLLNHMAGLSQSADVNCGEYLGNLELGAYPPRRQYLNLLVSLRASLLDCMRSTPRIRTNLNSLVAAVPSPNHEKGTDSRR
jgi:hypothetical protein